MICMMFGVLMIALMYLMLDLVGVRSHEAGPNHAPSQNDPHP